MYSEPRNGVQEPWSCLNEMLPPPKQLNVCVPFHAYEAVASAFVQSIGASTTNVGPRLGRWLTQVVGRRRTSSSARRRGTDIRSQSFNVEGLAQSRVSIWMRVVPPM